MNNEHPASQLQANEQQTPDQFGGSAPATHGQPVFPPVGVAENQLDKIQRELLQYGNLIQPPYFPVLSIEEFAGKNLVVLWAPGGQTRPYSCPKDVTAKHRTQHYYIRRYSSTVEAKGDDQRELLSLAATVPFDDRMCRAAMKRNGSPPPKFETDENRLWFVAKLPIHKAFRQADPLPDAGDATAQVTAQVTEYCRVLSSRLFC